MRSTWLSRSVLTALLFVLAMPGGAQAQERFSLEEALSSPFGTQLVTAPVDDRVAWVVNSEGVRNIFVAEPPDYAARQVTRYTDDDGLQISDLSFTPDGRAIVYVRGGAQSGTRLEREANPRTRPRGAERRIMLVPVDGGTPRELATGRSPSVSPRDPTVLFLRGGEVWKIPLENSGGEWSRAEEPRRLIADMGSTGTLRWSPDGDRLAFVSQRDQHSFIGVYHLREDSLTYLDPSVDRDQQPAWSPDGSRIAFVRVSADARDDQTGPRREAHPWSIRIVNLASGRAREVWRAREGAGSVFVGWGYYSGPSEQQIFWGTGDRIVFPWERTGWLHLYSVPVEGGEATDLTSGEFEVEQVMLSRDREKVVYSSNQDDLDRRHLWDVSVSGGEPRLLTPGNGIEWWPRPTSSGERLAFMASSATQPPHAEILEMTPDPGGEGEVGERRRLAPELMPETFPAESFVEPETVTFPATDEWQIHGQLFLPRGPAPEGGRPAVIYFHGGSRAQMLLGYHYHQIDYYQKMYALNQYLANAGYVVLSVNYRSGIGYGMEFREAPGYGLAGGSELRDVVGAGRYLAGRQDVDPNRIGLWGGSYGGYLTALGLACASDLFAAGVDLHGVHDWRVEVGRFSGVKDAELRMQLNRIAFESSPIAHVDTWRSPVLIVHGDDDRNVAFRETVDLIAKLRDRDVTVRQLVLPNEVHSFLLHESWLTAFEAAADFFEEKLGSLESGGDRMESGSRRTASAPECVVPSSSGGGNP